MDGHPPSEVKTRGRLKSCYRVLSKGTHFLWNATLLHCPICGKHPIFVPISKVKKIYDWLTPLDGCPKCGHAYDREAGYFLFAVWAFSYMSCIISGFLVYLLLSNITGWGFGWRLFLTMVLMFFFGFFSIRHAKAYFIAMDRFFDPEN